MFLQHIKKLMHIKLIFENTLNKLKYAAIFCVLVEILLNNSKCPSVCASVS